MNEKQNGREYFRLDAVGESTMFCRVTSQEKTDALEAARLAGIDLHLVESNLALTPEQRVLRHESALELAQALREAGAALYAKPSFADSAAR